jgi:hypothetical protein
MWNKCGPTLVGCFKEGRCKAPSAPARSDCLEAAIISLIEPVETHMNSTVVIAALLCTVGTIVPATAVDRSTAFLKGVKIVSYKLSVEPPNKGRCAIDLKAWNTAIDQVANQSRS